MIINTDITPKIYKKTYQGKEVNTYRFLLMDETQTRNDFRYRVNGIDFKAYKDNPVILVNHEGKSIGRAIEIERKYNKAYVYIYVSKNHPEVESDIKEGILNAVSLTVIPKVWTPYTNYTMVEESEALEISLVTIPNLANATRKNNFNVNISNEANMNIEELLKQYREQATKLSTLENSLVKKENEMLKLQNKIDALPKPSEGVELDKFNEAQEKIKTLENSYEEQKKKYDEQVSTIEKLTNKLEGLKERIPTFSNGGGISVKEPETHTLGDLMHVEHLAMRNGKNPIEVLKNKITSKNSNDYDKYRYTKALGMLLSKESEEGFNELVNAYNLGSIVDGAKLADPRNALPLQEILRPENSLLGTPGVKTVPFVNGKASFPVQTSKGDAAAYSNNGTDEPKDVQSGFGEVELQAKEIMATIEIRNYMLRHGSPQMAALVESLMIKDVQEKAEYLALLGSGANSEPLGILKISGVKTSNAQSGSTAAKINEDIRTIRKGLARSNVRSENIRFFMHEVTKISAETQYSANGDLIFYAQMLMQQNRLHGKAVQIVNQMPATDSEAYLFACDPGNIVLGVGNGLTVTASEHSDFKKDKTVVKGIFDLDITLIDKQAAYRLDNVFEWEGA